MPDIDLENGHRISFHDSGDGLPILFLHSFGHNRNLWFPQLDCFCDLGYRVIAPDMPGHGSSPLRPDLHSVDAIGASYVELLQQLGVERAIVAGISIGGYIALRMWARRPELIAALVMICTKAEADSEEIRGRRAAQIDNIEKNGLENFVESGAPKRISAATLEKRPWVLDWIKMMNYTVSAEANAATLQAMADKPDDVHTLATIDVPTLILSGSDDIFIPGDAPYNLERGIAKSQHFVIEDAGHVASLERPAEVNRRMTEFLQQHELR